MGIMKVTELKGIGPSYEKRLGKAGIKNVYDLREINIRKVSKISGIGEDVLRKWKEEAMKIRLLTDIKGIGNGFRKKLERRGIKTIEDLANADKGIAARLGVSEKRFEAWVKEARKMAPVKKAKRAVLAEEIGPDNASIRVRRKVAEVKIKEKIHEGVPVFRGNIGEAAEGNSIAVNIDGSGKIKLWFNGRWYDDVPAVEETFWERIKKSFGGKD